jgi:hypothetical protein
MNLIGKTSYILSEHFFVIRLLIIPLGHCNAQPGDTLQKVHTIETRHPSIQCLPFESHSSRCRLKMIRLVLQLILGFKVELIT